MELVAVDSRSGAAPSDSGKDWQTCTQGDVYFSPGTDPSGSARANFEIASRSLDSLVSRGRPAMPSAAALSEVVES